MPTTIGATQPAIPRIGFGKPNTLPCHESRFALHCTSTLRSHDAIASGFARACSFSIVSEKAAHQPTTPGDHEPDGEARRAGVGLLLGHASDYGIEICTDAAPVAVPNRGLRRGGGPRALANGHSGGGSAIMGVDDVAAAP